MSAQIRRRNDRSKLVERDYGRRLYATDVSYPEAMRQKTQKYLDSVMLIKHSEFEKPYLEDDYGTMQYGPYPPYPPYPPPYPPYPPVPDCWPKNLGAWGALGSYWELCAEEDPSATVYLFGCCHKIIRFSTPDPALTLTVVYLENDQCVVTITGVRGKDNLRILLELENITLEELISRECCSKESISIGYTSQQMSCDGTQTLTALPATDAGSCFTWSLSGGGSLSATTGKSVVYTAPSSNAECANNPTITLTSKSGATATLKIAVNCYTGSTSDIAYKYNYCSLVRDWTCISNACPAWSPIYILEDVLIHIYENRYGCGGNFIIGPLNATGCEIFCNYQNYCPGTCDRAPCAGASGINAACSGIFGTKCTPTRSVGNWDQRTAAMITAGCCPAALL